MNQFSNACSWADRRSLPSVSAVYALHGCDGDLLYIGESQNLRRRIATHNHANQMCDESEVRWFEVDESERRASEDAS